MILLRPPLSWSLFFKNRYSLTDVIIVHSTEISYSYPDALKAVGAAASNYLSQTLTSGCILGVEWGMTAYNISQAFTNNFVKDVFVVQLLGCSYQSKYNTDNVVAEFARKLHTVPFTLPFPVIVENLSLAEVLRKESRVAQIFGLYEQIDIALLTVGEIGMGSTNYIEGFVSKEEMRELVRQGAVGDICGRYLDIEGNICHHELYQRAVSIDFEQIRKIKMPILVANGPGKVKGILGALNSNLCKVLITDEDTATMMRDLII